MKDKPILFNTQMVQALLDGRKIITRRIIKPQPKEQIKCVIHHSTEERACWMEEHADQLSKDFRFYKSYEIGDRLWVQETWKIDGLIRERPDYPMAIDFRAVQSGYSQAEVMVRFTQDRFEKFKKFYQKPGWQSPYFMPKEAARIWLEVTNVRVERVQDISNEDRLKEGIRVTTETAQNLLNDCKTANMGRNAFASLWNSTIKKKDLSLYGWDVNPWIWVIEFKRLEEN